MLLKTARIRRFQALTNREALIGCRPEVGRDLDLMRGEDGSKMRIVLDVMLDVEEVCSLGLFIEHLVQVVDSEV